MVTPRQRYQSEGSTLVCNGFHFSGGGRRQCAVCMLREPYRASLSSCWGILRVFPCEMKVQVHVRSLIALCFIITELCFERKRKQFRCPNLSATRCRARSGSFDIQMAKLTHSPRNRLELFVYIFVREFSFTYFPFLKIGKISWNIFLNNYGDSFRNKRILSLKPCYWRFLRIIIFDLNRQNRTSPWRHFRPTRRELGQFLCQDVQNWFKKGCIKFGGDIFSFKQTEDKGTPPPTRRGLRMSGSHLL